MDEDDLILIGKFVVIPIIIIIAIALFFVFVYPSLFPPQEHMPSQLDVNLETLSGKALELVPLDVRISNTGGKASNVIVILSSVAFGQHATSPFTIATNEEKSETVNVNIEDLSNQNYPVTVSYQYDNMNDTANPISEQFYVIPNVRLADVVYSRPLIYEEKDHIEQLGNTELNFKVESNSEISSYTHLSASLGCLQSGQNLVITPSEIPVEDVGPQGKTENQYTFRIEGNNSPVGTYTLELVLSCDGYEVTTKTRTLYVK